MPNMHLDQIQDSEYQIDKTDMWSHFHRPFRWTVILFQIVGDDPSKVKNGSKILFV